MDDLVLQDTKNQAWKDDKSRFGFKMLQKMGWKEDKGLGKNDSGSVASIKVSKREEGLGLGMEKVWCLLFVVSQHANLVTEILHKNLNFTGNRQRWSIGLELDC